MGATWCAVYTATGTPLKLLGGPHAPSPRLDDEAVVAERDLAELSPGRVGASVMWHEAQPHARTFLDLASPEPGKD